MLHLGRIVSSNKFGCVIKSKSLIFQRQQKVALNHLFDSSKLFSTSPASDQKPVSETKPKGFLDKFFGAESNVASPTFKNRWSMLLPAIAAHICIGSPYAWSIMADAITRENGFVTSAASDWTMMQTSMCLSIVFACHGISAASLGKWQLKVGPRKSVALSALSFGSGLTIGSLGIYLHSLPLIYFGYGVLGGAGIGLGYNPPVQALLQWFPDKKGLASGLAIAGFGSGALLFTPAVQYLMKKFSKLPEYLGPAENFITKTVDGKLFADVNGALVEVINAGTAELSKIPYTLSEGLYVVGSGSTGAAEALGIMGAAYFATLLSSSLSLKLPHPTFVPDGAVSNTPSTDNKSAAPAVVYEDISVEEATKSSQFPLLGITFFCLATGGMGMFSVAKPMMSEVFSAALPAVVTSAFASQFVLMISGGNLGGRLGWAAVSDAIGRRNTFMIFTACCIPVYLSLPYLVESVVTTGGTLPLYLFCAGTMIGVSGMGGAFALLPAYEADLFGTKNIAAIHGRMLLFSSSAGVFGPYMLLKLRSISEQAALDDLLSKISPDKFQAAFNLPIDRASELIAAKTVTISKLLALAPPGTIDPTPHLYDSTMYALSGMMIVGFLSHAMVKPLHRKVISPVPAVGAEATVIDTSKVIEVKVKEESAGDRQLK